MKKQVILLWSLLVLTVNAVWGQVSGTISDENGEPLIGATVMVKGTSKGSVSDVGGRKV